MKKRAQITIFIILGLVVLSSVLFLLYAHSIVQKSEYEVENKKQVNFESKVGPVENYISSCAKTTLTQAIDAEGLNENEIENYINNNLKECVDTSIFKGLDFSTADVSSEVLISSKSANAHINFPIEIKSGSFTKELREFYSSYELIMEGRLPIDISNIVTDEVVLSSATSNAKVTIPRGTKATISNDIIDVLEIKLLNVSANNVGLFNYDLKPDRALFDPYIELEIDYKDEDNDGIVDGTNVPEKDLQIRYLDNSTDSWVNLPTEVDIIHNTVKARITHFTEFGIGIPEKVFINVTNPIQLERQNEFIKYVLELDDRILHKDNIDFVTVYDSLGTEILSDHMSNDIIEYPSGFVQQINLVFQDNFVSNEEKNYEIRLNDITTLTEDDLSIGLQSTDSHQIYHINNGLDDYYIKKFPDDVPEDNRMFTIVTSDGGIKLGLVSNVPDNVFSKGDQLVTYRYGEPEITVENNKLFFAIYLNYSDPKPDGPGHQGITADAKAIFYRDTDRIDVNINYYVTQKFSNHNGFKNGFAGTTFNDARFTFGREWYGKDSDKMYLFHYYPEQMMACLVKGGYHSNEGIDRKCRVGGQFDRYYALETSNGKTLFAYLPLFKDETHFMYNSICDDRNWLDKLIGEDVDKESLPSSGYGVAYSLFYSTKHDGVWMGSNWSRTKNIYK